MRKVWTKKDIKILKKLYPTTPTKNISELLNRSISSVYGAADIHNIKKSKEFMRTEASGRMKKGTHKGRQYHFKKGHKPWNAGTKGLMKPNSGTFKSGHKPPNTLFDGAIRTRIETTRSGKQIPYKWIRISKAKWKMLHVYNWEKKNGPLPKGYILVFKNGDTTNCDIKNLRMISNADHMRETHLKDETLAVRLSQQKWAGGNRKGVNREFYKEILKQKELLNLKRQQLILNKIIKTHEQTGKTK